MSAAADHFAGDKICAVYGAAIVVVSDRAHSGERPDETAPLLKEVLEKAKWRVVETVVVPDEFDAIRAVLQRLAHAVDLVLTTGGTGPSPRDVTPEATRAVTEKELPGVVEAMRMKSFEKAPGALGSRAVAGIVGRCVIVNLPGNPGGARECLEWTQKGLRHIVSQAKK